MLQGTIVVSVAHGNCDKFIVAVAWTATFPRISSSFCFWKTFMNSALSSRLISSTCPYVQVTKFLEVVVCIIIVHASLGCQAFGTFNACRVLYTSVCGVVGGVASVVSIQSIHGQ